MTTKKTDNTNLKTMEELLASYQKPLSVSRNEEVTGVVVAIFEKEIIVDLGAKSEGVLDKRDLPQEDLEKLKVGDSITSFVESESDSGQIILSLIRKVRQTKGFSKSSINWDKFNTLLKNKSKLKVSVLETNRGGLVVESDGNRGFIPTSQVDPRLITEKGIEGLIGQSLEVSVIEVDPNNNRLVFGQKSPVDEEKFKTIIEKYPNDEVVKGVVANVSDSGVVISLEDVEGFITSNKLEGTTFTVGQSASFIVEGVDKAKKRINLSPMLTSTKGLIYK